MAHKGTTRSDKDRQQRSYTGSQRLRRIMETPPGFWLSRGIGVVFLILTAVFLLACLVPLPGYAGRSFVEMLLSPSP